MSASTELYRRFKESEKAYLEEQAAEEDKKQTEKARLNEEWWAQHPVLNCADWLLCLGCCQRQNTGDAAGLEGVLCCTVWVFTATRVYGLLQDAMQW